MVLLIACPPGPLPDQDVLYETQFRSAFGPYRGQMILQGPLLSGRGQHGPCVLF